MTIKIIKSEFNKILTGKSCGYLFGLKIYVLVSFNTVALT